MIIATSICVDTEKDQGGSHYPQLIGFNPESRKRVFWQCAISFFASSVRMNPSVKHLLFTNDQNPPEINGQSAKAVFERLNVTIIDLPFKRYLIPQGLGTKFRNAYYKLDVLVALSQLESPSFLFDSDCIWLKPGNNLFALASENNLVLYDVLHCDLDPDTGGIPRAILGDRYRHLFPEIAPGDPIQFGGEMIGGSPQSLKELVVELDRVFDQSVKASNDAAFPLTRDTSIFDGDEYMTSLAVILSDLPWRNAAGFIRRIWTCRRARTSKAEDLNLTILHLPNEKDQGIPLLTKWILEEKTTFWALPENEWRKRLGRFLGIRGQISMPARYARLTEKRTVKAVQGCKSMIVRILR